MREQAAQAQEPAATALSLGGPVRDAAHLQHEEEVEEHRREAEAELDGVADELGPLARAARVQQQLAQRERATWVGLGSGQGW